MRACVFLPCLVWQGERALRVRCNGPVRGARQPARPYQHRISVGAPPLRSSSIQRAQCAPQKFCTDFSRRCLKFWAVNVLHLQGDVFFKLSILVPLHHNTHAYLGSFNGLGDCSATAIAEGLRHTTKLRHLSLWWGALACLRWKGCTILCHCAQFIFSLYWPCTLSSLCWFCVST